MDLQPISETFTGEVTAKVSDGGASLQPELSLEELVRQAKPAVVYLKALDKAGSGFFVTSGRERARHRLINKNVTGIGFALSATDLLDVLSSLLSQRGAGEPRRHSGCKTASTCRQW